MHVLADDEPGVDAGAGRFLSRRRHQLRLAETLVADDEDAATAAGAERRDALAQ